MRKQPTALPRASVPLRVPVQPSDSTKEEAEKVEANRGLKNMLDQVLELDTTSLLDNVK